MSSFMSDYWPQYPLALSECLIYFYSIPKVVLQTTKQQRVTSYNSWNFLKLIEEAVPVIEFHYILG